MTPTGLSRFYACWVAVLLQTLDLGVWGQVTTGAWEDQPNFTKCVDVAAASGSSFALVAVETSVYTMGLDAEGLPSGELQRIGKAQGLSRADITSVAVAPSQNLAVVAYSEGTFDLLSMDADGALANVLTVVDFAEADLLGSKRPNRLVVSEDRLLLCTDIGVIEYDLIQLEVRDTWKLEQDGTALRISSAVRQGEKWWVSTNQGLWSAPVDALFLGNPASWSKEAGLQVLGAENLMDLVALDSGDLAVIDQREGPNAVWVGNPEMGVWNDRSEGIEEEWSQLSAVGDQLWAIAPFGVMSWADSGDPGELRSQVGSVFLAPAAIAAASGGLWLANKHTGAFRLDAQGTEFDGPMAPNGPGTNSCFRMDAWNEFLWVATGGTDASGVPLYRAQGFSGRKNGFWRHVPAPQGEAGSEGVQDPMDVSIDPTDPERAVFGSLEEGLIEIRGQQVTAFWNPGNSPLDWNSGWNVDRCAVPTLDFDRQGNLWVANTGTEHPIKMLDSEGEWHVFEIEGFGVNTRFNRIFATQSDQVWMLLGDGQGVAVLATEGTPNDPGDDDVRFLNSGEGQGGLPSPVVYSVEEDLDGEIWLGTLQGPAVFYQPSSLFDPDPVDAQQILIEQDGNFQYLLETETVLDIALDGGNRKWLATVNSGVFLLSPDGREQVDRFTSSNSPLPADEVYDIAIDQSSGMVFFSTPQGVTGYRGTATNFFEDNQDGQVVIFPNPWRPNDAPRVTIDGLAFGTEVHIINSGGGRVRKLESDGGRAVWDTLDDSGRPVPEGVYFVLAGEAGGKTGSSGKMVILR